MYHKMKHISSHTTEEYSPIWGLSQKITIGVVYRNINVGLRVCVCIYNQKCVKRQKDK